jgi:kinesin family protein 15
MDQRKTDLLETQLLVEQLEQREQMLEAQIEILQVSIRELPSPHPSQTEMLNCTCVFLQLEKDNLQQKIMEMDETMELLVRSNQPETDQRMVKYLY